MKIIKLMGLLSGHTARIKMLVMSGESNSGGIADNLQCTSDELSPRIALNIYNPYTTAFQTMQIGVNNLLQHNGLIDNAYHSWENGLSNLASSGTIQNPAHLVKTGEGGSKISEWNTGGLYSNRFNDRVNNAISILNINTVDDKFALLYSQGINDRLDVGWDAPTWVAATIARFSYLRTTYGMFPIVMTKFTSYPELDAYIDAICLAVDNCYSIDTSDLTMNANHWDYASQKTIAGRMVSEFKLQGYLL